MNVFDIIGPIMIGPSSSHTAGAVRIGQFAHQLLGEKATTAEVVLYGSFARTYKGHGTDKALAAGIMGMNTEDIRIKESLEIAQTSGLKLTITTNLNTNKPHPNTVELTLKGSTNSVSIEGQSIGGGNICITNINGMEVVVNNKQDTLIVVHKDTPGTVAAVTEYVGRQGANIANIHLSRQTKGGQAIMTIELDGTFDKTHSREIEKLKNIYSVTIIPHI